MIVYLEEAHPGLLGWKTLELLVDGLFDGFGMRIHDLELWVIDFTIFAF